MEAQPQCKGRPAAAGRELMRLVMWMDTHPGPTNRAKTTAAPNSDKSPTTDTMKLIRLEACSWSLMDSRGRLPKLNTRHIGHPTYQAIVSKQSSQISQIRERTTTLASRSRPFSAPSAISSNEQSP